MTVFVLVFVSGKSVLVFSVPPASGDWVVTGTESYYDEVIVLSGNLIVEDGGNLTFRKVTLKMNCTYNGQFNITVKPGGEFYVLEGSVITSADPNKRYGFSVWSTFRMNNSELHGCGWAWPFPERETGGLVIWSGDAVVENSLLSHNWNGIDVRSDGVVVRNNNVTENDETGIGVDSCNSTIYNNYVSWNNRTGIGIGGHCSPIIYNNTVTSNSWAGINPCEGASPKIQNNIVMKNGIGIFCVFNASPTISGNLIAENLEQGIGCHSYSSPTIANNTITSNLGEGIGCGDHSDAVIQGNTITNNSRGITCGLASPTICNNTITSNLGNGIECSYSNATIQNNVISFNEGGIHFDNSNPTIEGNFFSNNSQGISCGFSSGVIRGNTFTNSGNSIDLYWSSPIIQGNIITTNTGTGVWCMNHSNPAIQGNIITFNIGYGIGCNYGSQPEIHQNDIYGQNNYGLCNEDDSVTVNATYNYWGSESGPALGQADAVDPEEINGSVLFNPWLTESIFSAEITNPLSGETVSSTVTVSTEVHAQNGFHKTEFYIDNKLEYTDCDMPYEWNWDTTQYTETEHKITTKAYDMLGLKISTSITVSVDNTPPTVAMISPEEDSFISGIANITFGFSDDNLESATLSLDGKIISDVTYKTFHLWNTTEITDGEHVLTLIVSDKASHTKTIERITTVDNTLPTAEIREPAENAYLSGSYEVVIYGYDANLDVIELYIGQSLVASWKVSGTHTYTQDIGVDGTYTIKLIVKDKAENNIVETVTVIVDNTAPTVSIKEPTPENIYYGTVSVSVNATDNQELVNVQFRVDNTEWTVMTYDPTDLLWKHDLNTTTLSDGQHTLMVLALDKAINLATTSTTLLADNTPPTLTIQTPQSGITVGLTLIVDVQASDITGILRIEFYLQDVLVHTVSGTPYQWSWDTTKHPNGEYTIAVKAYDTVGHTQTNETTVTVKNVESPWWQTNLWTIIQVLVAIGGLILALLAYLTKKKEEKKKKRKK